MKLSLQEVDRILIPKGVPEGGGKCPPNSRYSLSTHEYDNEHSGDGDSMASSGSRARRRESGVQDEQKSDRNSEIDGIEIINVREEVFKKKRYSKKLENITSDTKEKPYRSES